MMGWQRLSGMLVVSLLVVNMGRAEDRSRSWRGASPPVPEKRHTLKELRDQYVVKQQRDYSCGTSALATLITYYFGEQTSEEELLKLLISQLTQEDLTLKEKSGFSLLDLKKIAEAKGYQAAGFMLTVEQLKQLAAPVIVHVQPRGYQHFAVLRGVVRGRVFLADPARGNLRMSIERFAREWSGAILVLGKPGEADIPTYPLALPQSDYIQPERLAVGRLSDPNMFPIHLAVRSTQPALR
jgi:uncharacterized protein